MASEHEILLLILCTGFHGLGLLGRFVALNFHLLLGLLGLSMHNIKEGNLLLNQ
jgi:hypothetical protein